MAVLVRQAILNQVREKKLAHAYLIETNNLLEFEIELKEILKIILCEEDNEYCNSCQQCHFVDNDNHPNIIRIAPDGVNIKIAQVEELQKKFSTKAFFGKYNIYIISEADKLNQSAANALLKFLEEPEENIIGLLLTTKKDLVLPTITSRCQILTEKFDICEDNNGLKENATRLLDLTSSIMGIYDVKDYIGSLEDKNDLKHIFSYLLQDELEKGKEFNLRKVKIYHRFLEKIKYNVNMELLLEEFIIEMSEVK